MKYESINIKVSVLTPDELFDLVTKKVNVPAYSIYHKEASEITPEDISKAVIGRMPTNYIKFEGGEEIFFRHWPVEFYRTKKQFCFSPTNDGVPCKAAYIVID